MDATKKFACSVCKEHGPFSKRQYKRAEMGHDVQCTNCIDKVQRQREIEFHKNIVKKKKRKHQEEHKNNNETTLPKNNDTNDVSDKEQIKKAKNELKKQCKREKKEMKIQHKKEENESSEKEKATIDEKDNNQNKPIEEEEIKDSKDNATNATAVVAESGPKRENDGLKQVEKDNDDERKDGSDTNIKKKEDTERKKVDDKMEINEENEEMPKNDEERDKETKPNQNPSDNVPVSSPKFDDSSHDDNDDNMKEEDMENGVEDQEVSLLALKHSILGRDVHTEYNESDDDDEHLAKENNSQQQVKQDVQCSVCYEVLYQPVSLVCGHSFCRDCLSWWCHFQRSRNQSSDDQDEDSNNDDDNHQKGSCPTCRTPIVTGSALGINTALQSCLQLLFPNEWNVRRRQQKLKAKTATKGENEGRHGRGFEILTCCHEKPWKELTATSSALKLRRSIVLDADDQRMQLGLSLRRNPKLYYSDQCYVLQLHLCLLSMEEDEAGCEGEGFPIIVNEANDDQHFVCTDRFKYSFLMAGLMQNEPTSTAKSQDSDRQSSTPISRVLTGHEAGVFMLRIRLTKELISEEYDKENPSDTITLQFQHEDTGAELLIQLPSKLILDVKQSSEFMKQEAPVKDKIPRKTKHQIVDIEDDDEEEEINDEEDIDDEAQAKSGEICTICRDGGDLILCDGGDELEGCGRGFHISCVKRKMIPHGDWVCQQCANDAEIDVGIEGHEFEPQENDNDGMFVDDDDDEPETPIPKNKKKIQNHALSDDDDDDDDNSVTFSPMAKTKDKDDYGHGDDDDDDDDGDGDDHVEIIKPRKSAKRKRFDDSDEDDTEWDGNGKSNNNKDDDEAHAGSFSPPQEDIADEANNDEEEDDIPVSSKSRAVTKKRRTVNPFEDDDSD